MKYPHEQWIIKYCKSHQARLDILTPKEQRGDIIHYLLKHIKRTKVKQ